jgi:methylmalonyl-CoA mutase, N-terminal domain
MSASSSTAGEFPFRGGITTETYQRNPWIIGQYSGFASPEDANRRYRELITQGQQGLAIALDLPTQVGLDPDDARAYGEVGRVGVSLACLDDVDALLAGIELSAVRQISTTANSIGPLAIALFLALAKRRGVDPSSFSVRLQNDVLKEYVARGTQFLPVRPALELSVDAIEYSVRNLPNWVPISISGYHMRDAGASPARELGFTLANARAYLQSLQLRGVDPADVARRVTWFLSASAQPLNEAAKFRAARELWATTLAEDFNVQDKSALTLRIIAYTLGSECTPSEILNNAVRITLAATGAVLGGVQTLFCSSIDEALGLPTDDHALLSVRTQQILLNESGLAMHVDALGGSPIVERLTDEFVAEARAIDREVIERGGAEAAIESGWMRQCIDEDAWRAQQSADKRVGAGSPAREDIEVFKIPLEFEPKRVSEFSAMKRARSREDVEAGLRLVKSDARERKNLVPSLTSAFTAGVTLGEICEILREIHGVAPGRSTPREPEAIG